MKSISGIVIKVHDSNEADKIVKIITSNGDKLSLLAKGVKKSKSKKSHAIELGNHIKIQINNKYNIPIITEIKVLNEPFHWKESYRLLILLQLACEILESLTAEDLEDPRFFLHTKQFLYTEYRNFELTFAIWMLYMLNVSGNLGNLKLSVITGNDIKLENVAKLTDKIGYINFNESEFAQKIDSRIIKSQLFALKTNLYSASRIKLNEELTSKLFDIHMDWIEIAIEKQLKSRKLLY
ncbi:MAG: hypothetical protein KatS3mg086_111 [Candidatus Dojkabacteria bacterium]|nr:MAG: hypothetical protein KatS3mg086_111 [Candidatus Dojkabacteria bacterium]